MVGKKQGRHPQWLAAKERLDAATSAVQAARADRSRQQRSQECSNRSRSASMVKSCSGRLAKLDRDIERAQAKVGPAQAALARAKPWTQVDDVRKVQVEGTLHSVTQRGVLVLRRGGQASRIDVMGAQTAFDTDGVPAHQIRAAHPSKPTAADATAALVRAAAARVRSELQASAGDCEAAWQALAARAPADSDEALNALAGAALCKRTKPSAVHDRRSVAPTTRQALGFLAGYLGRGRTTRMVDWLWREAAELPMQDRRGPQP